MTEFITRVELHEANWSDYKELHAVMVNAGFSRQIDGGRSRYDLPSAEYFFRGELSSEKVLESAKKAIQKTWKGTFGVMTIQSNGPIYFYGLKLSK